MRGDVAILCEGEGRYKEAPRLLYLHFLKPFRGLFKQVVDLLYCGVVLPVTSFSTKATRQRNIMVASFLKQPL